MGASFLERNRKTEVAVITGESENVSQAIYTAQKISSMLKEKVQVDNKDGKSSRDCTRRDFCILLRRKSDAAVYVNELSKLGIPAYSEETSGYLKSREISVILNILRKNRAMKRTNHLNIPISYLLKQLLYPDTILTYNSYIVSPCFLKPFLFYIQCTKSSKCIC